MLLHCYERSLMEGPRPDQTSDNTMLMRIGKLIGKAPICQNYGVRILKKKCGVRTRSYVRTYVQH